jgi:hypothetical protein
MKKRLKKLEKSYYIFILLILASVFLLIINFIPVFRIDAGLTTEFTNRFDSEYSVYVNQTDPDKNYNDHYYYRIIGNSCETYIHYNLNSLPEETVRLYFTIGDYDFYNVEWGHYPQVDDIEINIISIEENWNVSELTWNNKPKHGEIIKTVNISRITQGWVIDRYNLQKVVDISEILTNEELEDFSLCINITKNNENLNCSVSIYSYLLWNYEIVVLSYTNIISTSIIFSLLAVTIFFFRKEIYTCPNCGLKKIHTEVICPKCDTVFNDSRISKRSDYQLILIFLWTFIFFEGLYLIILAIVNWLFYYQPILTPLLALIWIIIYYKIIKKKLKRYKEMKL